MKQAEQISSLPNAPTHPIASRAENIDKVDTTGDSAASPSGSRNPFSFLSSVTQRTPKGKTPIKPSGDEMHPDHHQKSTATPYDEARWLGFFNMGPVSAPPKTSGTPKIMPASPTPTKEAALSSAGLGTSEFKFAYKRQSLELSPEAQKLMSETREEAAKIRARMSMLPPTPANEPGAESPTTGRKIATPKGKVGRFTNAHLAEFKKMESIANHPSTWRTNPMLAADTKKGLKRSPSKAELDTYDSNTILSKAGNVAAMILDERESESTPSKRMKVDACDDASSKRVVQTPSKLNPFIAPKTAPIGRRKTGMHRPLSSLMSPTKASLARSQSVKNLRAANVLPALTRTNSVKSFRSPFTPRTRIDTTAPKPASPAPIKVHSVKDAPPVKAPEELTKSPSASDSDTMTMIKSILRTPHRLYSNDPTKIAAGTHVATPPSQVTGGRQTPKTAPVQKHVDFTASALAKAQRDEVKAASVEPESVRYPTLPTIASVDDTADRRSTISSLPIPGAFTFRSGTPVSFGNLPAGPTIRAVRDSDSDSGLPSIAEDADAPSGAASLSSPSKRKLAQLFTANPFASEPDGDDDKENEDAAADERPAKRLRRADASPPSPQKRSPAKLVKKSRLPTPKKGRGLTATRLNMLAMPRHR